MICLQVRPAQVKCQVRAKNMASVSYPYRLRRSGGSSTSPSNSPRSLFPRHCADRTQKFLRSHTVRTRPWMRSHATRHSQSSSARFTRGFGARTRIDQSVSTQSIAGDPPEKVQRAIGQERRVVQPSCLLKSAGRGSRPGPPENRQ